MKNPLSGKDLSPKADEIVTKFKAARSAARKDARSGNPAKRFPAQRAVVQAGQAIAALYVREVSR